MNISIHALREEGDLLIAGLSTFWSRFLSTPSARRATSLLPESFLILLISIHALREEGDAFRDSSTITKHISIHALREEGDLVELGLGGALLISIHALREEGDSKNRDKISIFKQIIQHSARI